jgi:protein-tyrosine kinase
MDSRPGLIERAAARLRDADAIMTAPPERRTPEFPGTVVEQPPLRRQAVLDHAHLAQRGISMPWATTARIVEEYRIIKRNIIFRWQTPEYLETARQEPRVIMVTSSKPREGKTFSAINLALAFAAEENLVTVLIDADPVRGDAANSLKVPAEPGLTGVLAGEVRLHEALIQTDLPNLVVLPPGAPGPHVPELLSGRAPGLLFAKIAARYPDHVIILDTAPCLASTDPAGLASVVNQIVFVVEAGHTQRAEIESSLNLLSSCRHISFVLNKAAAGSSDHFGAYTYYYQPEKAAVKAGVD